MKLKKTLKKLSELDRKAEKSGKKFIKKNSRFDLEKNEEKKLLSKLRNKDEQKEYILDPAGWLQKNQFKGKSLLKMKKVSASRKKKNRKALEEFSVKFGAVEVRPKITFSITAKRRDDDGR